MKKKPSKSPKPKQAKSVVRYLGPDGKVYDSFEAMIAAQPEMTLREKILDKLDDARRLIKNAYFDTKNYLKRRLTNTGFDRVFLHIDRDDWCDADGRLFHACFAVLGQFVEEELGKPSHKHPEKTYRGYREHFMGGHHKAVDLWLWYKEQKQNNFEGCDEFAVSKKDKSEIDKKLAELLEIRRSLWT